MDPICHTLVGASLGCTGLEKKTRYGRATLIVAANLPDIDVVAHFMGGAASYAFRFAGKSSWNTQTNTASGRSTSRREQGFRMTGSW